jgi:hypothetical protein
MHHSYTINLEKDRPGALVTGESYLTESPGRGLEAASPHLWREGLPWSIPPQTPLIWEPSAPSLPF